MIARARKNYERESLVTPTVGVSRTKQSFKDQSDVNAIVKKFQTTGQVSHQNMRRPTYTDVSNVQDLQACLAAVDAARDGFAALPSFIRSAADNDPLQLLRLMDSEDGLKILEEAGMINEPREPEEETPGEVNTPTPES